MSFDKEINAQLDPATEEFDNEGRTIRNYEPRKNREITRQSIIDKLPNEKDIFKIMDQNDPIIIALKTLKGLKNDVNYNPKKCYFRLNDLTQCLTEFKKEKRGKYF